MAKSRLSCAFQFLFCLCLLCWLPSRVAADERRDRGEAPRCALTGDAVPHGLVVLLPSGEKNYRAMNLEVVKNSRMSGVAVQVDWRDIEPVEGKPDWSKLDALFAAAEASKKWVHLIMFPGFFSPAWALDGAASQRTKRLYIVVDGPYSGG